MARRPIIGGLPNIVSLSEVTVDDAGGYTSATLPVANIQTSEPSEVTRVTVLDPYYTRWIAYWTTASNPAPLFEVDGIFLGNHNLEPTATYRFMGADRARSMDSITNIEAEPPTAIAASTNATGAVGNVDEALDAPDASFITPTTTTVNWDARFDFATPSVTPATGSQLQSFALYVVPVLAGGRLPGVKVELYESGVLVLDLGTQYVQQSQYLIFSWDAALLSTASGANVQCKVTGVVSGTSYVKLDTLCWYVEGDFLGEWDSGWLPVSSLTPAHDTGSYLAPVREPEPTRNIIYVPDTPWTDVGAIYVFVRAAHYATNSYYNAVTPATYVQFGILSAGPALELSRGIKPPGPRSRVITEKAEGNTAGGQSYSADVFRRRSVSADFILTRDELMTLLDSLDWRKGSVNPFWVALEPSVSASYQKFTSFLAVLSDSGDPEEAPTAYRTDGEMLYYKSYTFEEKL
jgi:hypothetical protein